MRTLIAPLLLASLPVLSATGELNDTGQTQCYDGSALVACSAANTGNAAAYPGQDGRYGRDPAYAAEQYAKTGGGVAGFDFTKICMSGEAAGTGSCPASPTVGTGANDWACTKDNHTNLYWSVEATAPSGNWTYATTTLPASYNSATRCGFSTGWRAPTRNELLSLVDHGAATSPVIDTGYFPGTAISYYWSSDVLASNPVAAWDVYFDNGGSNALNKSNTYNVRLVRSGQ